MFLQRSASFLVSPACSVARRVIDVMATSNT